MSEAWIIPQIQNLKRQILKLGKIECVWQFPPNTQFIMSVNDHNELYVQCGLINKDGNYISEYNEMCVININLLDLSQILTDETRWKTKTHPSVYNMFSNGKDLIPLINNIMKFVAS